MLNGELILASITWRNCKSLLRHHPENHSKSDLFSALLITLTWTVFWAPQQFLWSKKLFLFSTIAANILKIEGKLGAYAMKRVASGTHLSTPWLFEPETPRRYSRLLPSLQFPPLVQAPGTRFLQLSEVGRALWANIGEGSAQWALPANWAT